MSLLSDASFIANVTGKIFFPREYGFGGIPFDTVIRESHSSRSQLSRHPVELGLAVTDNIVTLPKELTIEGMVTSISSNEFFDWGLTGTASRIAGSLITTPYLSKPKTTWEALLLLQKQGTRVDVQTNLFLYENMVLVSIATTQERSSSGHLRFAARLEEVIIAEAVTDQIESIGDTLERLESESEIAKTNKETADRVQKVTKKGKQAEETVEKEVQGDNGGSLAYNIYKKLGF